MKNRKREIFIFVAGSTPQIITETVYALAVRRPPIHPDEIYVVTTTEGRRRINETLGTKKILRSLGREYGIPDLRIPDENIIVPINDGKELCDIRNGADNERMANAILALVREKTADESTRLHCSIAGGRKTMSFYMGAVFQLFARSWDRLYHVLVSPEFESHPEFFYKPARNRRLEAGNRSLNTRDAVIELAELPFIRLRGKVTLESADFHDLVKKGQRDIDDALPKLPLKLNMAKGTIHVGGKEIRLPARDFSVYAMYLMRKVNMCVRKKESRCDGCFECFPFFKGFDHFDELVEIYNRVMPSHVDDFKRRHEGKPLDEIIRQSMSRIKVAFRRALADKKLADYYSIDTLSRAWGKTVHGIRAEKCLIEIVKGS